MEKKQLDVIWKGSVFHTGIVGVNVKSTEIYYMVEGYRYILLLYKDYYCII